MASRRRTGVILGYTNIIAKNLVNLLYTPMLLAFVGRGDYGVFQTAHSFIYTLALLSFGFSGAYIRFYSQRKAANDEEGIRVLNGMYLVLYLLICAVVVALGFGASNNLGIVFAGGFTPEEIGLASSLSRIMALNIAATLLSTVFDAYIIAHEEFAFQQTRQIAATLSTPALALVLLNLGLGTVGVASAQLVVTVILLAINIRFAVGRLGMRFYVKRLDIELFRSVAVFSAWIFINQVCELINQNMPNVILGAVCGSAVVAVFAISLQIRHVFYSLSTTISNVFIPLVHRIVAESNDNKELTRLMTRVGRYQALLYFWVFGGFVILGRWFISVWANEGFMDAYYLILAMAFPLFIPLTQNVGIEIQKAKNMHHARSLVYLVMAAVNLALSYFLAPHLGYWAPVVGYDAYVLVGCGLFMNWYYHVRVGLDMGYYWRKALPVLSSAAMATALCFAGTQLVPVSSLAMFLLWGIVYSIVYVLLAWLVVLTGDERAALAKRLTSMFGWTRGKGRK